MVRPSNITRLLRDDVAGPKHSVGWKDPQTMTDIYQQPAGAALYTAALEVGKTG